MIWTIRSAIAMVLWIAAGLLALVLIFSGWILLPFAFAGGGGERFLILVLAIIGFSLAAHLLGRGAPGRDEGTDHDG
jgi:hypothetical protein